MLREGFEDVLNSLHAEAVRHYGDALITVGVFGSVGRGTPGPYSDVDVLIVAERLPMGRLSRAGDFAAVEQALYPMLQSAERAGCHTAISAVFKSREEVASGSLLFLDMIEDIRLLYDRDGFFREHLSSWVKKLTLLGARRIRRGSTWHWDLKPDYRPGEIIQL